MVGVLIDRVKEIERNPEKLAGFLYEIDDAFSSSIIRFVKIRDESKIIAVGDIHGDLASLSRAIEFAFKEGYPDRSILVFLGDYIDRGPNQIECILLPLMLLKNFPLSTIILRGNHEPPSFLIPYPHDFPYILIRKYGERGNAFYLRFLEIFEKMHLAALDTSRNVLFLHGGIPVRNYEKASVNDVIDYLGGESIAWKDEYTEILWNDPGEHVSYYEPSPRGVGYLWGEMVTLYLRERLGVSKIVRGHEPASEGYKLNHNNSVITLFSRLGPPYYNSKACVALFQSVLNDKIEFICWP